MKLFHKYGDLTIQSASACERLRCMKRKQLAKAKFIRKLVNPFLSSKIRHQLLTSYQVLRLIKGIARVLNNLREFVN